MIRRLKLRFVLINMSFITVMLCVIFATVLGLTRVNLENESLRMMEAIARNPFHAGPPGQQSEDVRLPYFAVQVDNSGELLALGGGYYDLSDAVLLRELIQESCAFSETDGVLPEHGLRFYRTVTPLGQCIVFSDLSSETRTLEGLVGTCAAIGGASFLAFLLLSLFLAGWAVRPIERAWSQQKRFVADVSHELKTPLTVILANAELLRRGTLDQETEGKTRENLLVVARQMRGLIENLLTLARFDAGKMPRVLCRVNWSQVVEDGVLPFEPIFFEQGMELDTKVEHGISVCGDEGRLEELLSILLDNAQKYGAKGVVRVTLSRVGRRYAELVVSNPGPAMQKEELRRIFERFYRSDKARSGAGSGLGLSIADTIVREHGGKIWAESAQGRNSFSVRLPLMRPPQHPRNS